MKKLLLLFMLFVTGLSLYGQKITNLTATTSAAGTNNIMTAATGSDQIKRITKAQFLVDYAVLASPTFTTQITLGSNAITETVAGYLDPTSSIQGQFNDIVAEQVDTVVLSGIVQMLSDTMLIASYTIGAGNAGDTVLFSTGDVIAALKWDGSHNLVITKITGVLGAGSQDIDIALLHDVNFKDATPMAVLSADMTITSSTTGDDITSFASATIAPLQWLWIRVDQATAQPTQCIINIYGYLTEL